MSRWTSRSCRRSCATGRSTPPVHELFAAFVGYKAPAPARGPAAPATQDAGALLAGSRRVGDRHPARRSCGMHGRRSSSRSSDTLTERPRDERRAIALTWSSAPRSPPRRWRAGSRRRRQESVHRRCRRPAKASFRRSSSSCRTTGSALLAIVAGGALFKEAIDSTVEWTGEVNQLSRRLGITTEDASGLAVALHHVGVSAESTRGSSTS
jgi:hypothetical protein